MTPETKIYPGDYINLKSGQKYVKVILSEDRRLCVEQSDGWKAYQALNRKWITPTQFQQLDSFKRYTWISIVDVAKVTPRNLEIIIEELVSVLANDK